MKGRKKVLLLAAVLSLCGVVAVPSAHAVTATASATAGANDASFGTLAWTIPAGSLTTASDANEASTARMRNATSNYLVATGFGFALPAGSTINGISVRIFRRADTTVVTDTRVRIVKGGTIQTTDRSAGATWPTTAAYATFGGAADLWGTTWTVADVNASNFGIAIACSAGGSNSYGYVDHIEITVTFSGTCVSAAPTVSILPSSQNVAFGKSVSYFMKITNNDNMFCGALNFTPGVSDTGATASFTVPSTLSPAGACTLDYQQSCSRTITVSAKATAAEDAAMTTTITVTEPTQHSGKNGTGAVTTTAIDRRLHNSKTTESSYWTSSWGVTGGKYGKFVCDTCHTRTTTNIKRVKTSITTPDATNWTSSGAASVGVNLQSTSTPNGFGDDTSTHATSTKVCEACHSQTSYHKYNQAAATHQNNTDCLSSCHRHDSGFKSDGSCKSCHNAAISEVYNTRQVSGAGGDFVRLSHHVNNGTTTEIVTDYDCIVCHAEGDASAAAAGAGFVNPLLHRNGSTSTTRMVNLRNVDNISQSYDWNKNARTTAMRDNMDTFCMNCHDANGATQISVNNANTGVFLNDTATVRTVTGAGNTNPNSVTVNLRPFNTNDQLLGNTVGVANLGTFRRETYGRVLDVKSQFNSGSAAGKAWASHHNLNQFAKRYTTKNTTNWPPARLTAYVTREGRAMNGTANGDGETAGLHCSDCHLNETNAHGAVNSRYMLDNGTVDQTDTDAAWTGTDGGTHVCYKCHNSTVYTAGGAGTAQTFAHDRDSTHTMGTMGSPMGIICFNCHAGYSTGPQGGLGAIHGTNESYIPGGAGATTKRYRFMSGATMRFYRPEAAGAGDIIDANWENASDSSCYTTDADTWNIGGCAQHSSGVDIGTTTGNRPLEQ